MRRRAAVTLALAGALSLPACSDGAKAADPVAALAKAKSTLDTATAVTVDLKSDTAIPSGHNGVSAAKGTGLISATDPRFKGSVSAVINGAPVTTDVIAIGKDTWMKLFTPSFSKVDVDKLGAPNPTGFFVPSTGLSALVDQVGSPAGGAEKRYGKEVLASYTGTVPGAVIKKLLNLGSDSATFKAEFGVVSETGELRTAKLTGPFYDTGDSTYTVLLTDYGKTIDITAP
jgi:lipoprotein LprG